MKSPLRTVIRNGDFKASEFPDVWASYDVMVSGCIIECDAAMPSHARYDGIVFKGWPRFTPDPVPEGFTNSRIELDIGWMKGGDSVVHVGRKAVIVDVEGG